MAGRWPPTYSFLRPLLWCRLLQEAVPKQRALHCCSCSSRHYPLLSELLLRQLLWVLRTMELLPLLLPLLL
jgi:hypothetical protein